MQCSENPVVKFCFSIKCILLSNNKKKLQKLEQNGIYKINCCDCDAIYIGQCGRSFKQRTKEHIQAIEKQNFTTGFSDHCINQNHNFKGEFEILHIVDKGGRMNIFENCCQFEEKF